MITPEALADQLDALSRQVASMQSRFAAQEQAALEVALSPADVMRRGSYPSGADVYPAGTTAPGQENILADNSVVSGTISDGAIDSLTSFTSSLRPVAIVATLPALPDAVYPVGSTVVLTTNGKLYRNVGNAWVNNLDGADLDAASVSGTRLIANTVTAAQIAAYTITAAEIAADTITAGQIAAGAISASELSAGSVIAGKVAANAIDGVSITATADINAYYFRSSFAFFYIWGTPDASGYSNQALYGARSNNHNIWTVDDPLWVNKGVSTVVVAGAVTDAAVNNTTLNGMLGVDSTNGRFYFRYGGAWHYVNQTAGFEIPAHETVCPVCELPLLPDQDLIGRGDRRRPDGSLHGLYIHLGCAGTPMNRVVADDYDSLAAHVDLDEDPAAKVVRASLMDRLTRKARKAVGLPEKPIVPPAPLDRKRFSEAAKKADPASVYRKGGA